MITLVEVHAPTSKSHLGYSWWNCRAFDSIRGDTGREAKYKRKKKKYRENYNAWQYKYRSSNKNTGGKGRGYDCRETNPHKSTRTVSKRAWKAERRLSATGPDEFSPETACTQRGKKASMPSVI